MDENNNNAGNISWTLIKIYELCKRDDEGRFKEELLQQLQEWGLIPKKVLCSRCESPMILGRYLESWRWHCTAYIVENKQKAVICRTTERLHANTFFAGSHLTYLQMLGFVHLWAEGSQLRFIGKQLGINSDHTLVDWSSFCREVSPLASKKTF